MGVIPSRLEYDGHGNFNNERDIPRTSTARARELSPTTTASAPPTMGQLPIAGWSFRRFIF